MLMTKKINECRFIAHPFNGSNYSTKYWGSYGTDSQTIQAQWFAFPLLFQTAFLAIGWSAHHSEIVCEKGNSNGKDYCWVPVVTAKRDMWWNKCMWVGPWEAGAARWAFMSTSVKQGSPSRQGHTHTLGKMLKKMYLSGGQAPVSQELFCFWLSTGGAFLAGALLANILRQRSTEKKTRQSLLWKQVDRVWKEGIVNWLPSQLSREITSHWLGNRVVVRRAVFLFFFWMNGNEYVASLRMTVHLFVLTKWLFTTVPCYT